MIRIADNIIPITAGSGTSVRTVTNAGVDSGAHQQVVTLGDSAGNLIGTTAAPFPVSIAASGGLSTTAGTISATAANTPGTAVTTSTTAQIVAAVSTAGNVTFHLVSSAFVGTLTFEGSVDAGLNYAPIMAIREDGTGAETSTALSIASAFIRLYTAALPGVAYFRVRCSAFTSGTIAVILAPGPTLIEPTPSLGAGTQTIGNVGLTSGSNQVGSVTIGNGTTLSTLGGTSSASTNATSVKATPGTLFELTVSNPTATVAYFKLYNKASAPTVGTDVPIATYRIAATASAGDTITLDFGANGKRFTTGIAYSLSGAAVATDTTSSVAGIQIHGTYI